MKRVLVSGAGVVLLVMALVGAPPARAAGVKGVGWWSDAPTASAPAGGVAIGANPSGPAAVAAVLLDLAQGASRGTISLHQSGGAAPAGAAIVACVVGSFTPVEHGPMADAPATACDTTSTPVKVSGDGVTWSADITDLLGDKKGTVGIALVPAPGAALFDLQFDTVSATVSPVAGGGSSSSGGRSTATTMAPRPSSSPSPAASSPRPAASTFTPPSAPSVAAPTSPTTVAPESAANDAATEAAAGATEVAAGGSVALPTAESTGATSEPSGSASQALGYAMLAAVVGVVGGVGHRVASKRFAV